MIATLQHVKLKINVKIKHILLDKAKWWKYPDSILACITFSNAQLLLANAGAST